MTISTSELNKALVVIAITRIIILLVFGLPAPFATSTGSNITCANFVGIGCCISVVVFATICAWYHKVNTSTLVVVGVAAHFVDSLYWPLCHLVNAAIAGHVTPTTTYDWFVNQFDNVTTAWRIQYL